MLNVENQSLKKIILIIPDYVYSIFDLLWHGMASNTYKPTWLHYAKSTVFFFILYVL